MAVTRRVLAIAVAALLLAGAAWFTVRFRNNLHCDQYTSFRIATFDMLPHVEEAIEGGPPLVYRPGLAVPLRAYLSSALLAFLLFPPVGAAFVLSGRLEFWRWVRFAAVLGLLVLANALLPTHIVGERYKALSVFALVLAALPLVALGLVLRWERPPRAPGGATSDQ